MQVGRGHLDMARLGGDMAPFPAPVETGSEGRGDQERSRTKRNRGEDKDGDWQGEDCGQLVVTSSQGVRALCRESFGHGAEVGGAGWGKVVKLNSLRGRDHVCGQAMAPFFLPSPPPVPGLAAIFHRLSPILV